MISPWITSIKTQLSTEHSVQHKRSENVTTTLTWYVATKIHGNHETFYEISFTAVLQGSKTNKHASSKTTLATTSTLMNDGDHLWTSSELLLIFAKIHPHWPWDIITQLSNLKLNNRQLTLDQMASWQLLLLDKRIYQHHYDSFKAVFQPFACVHSVSNLIELTL